MFEFDARKDFEHAVEDEVVFLVFDVLHFEELFVAEVDECLVLVVARVAAVDALVFFVQERELYFGVDGLGVLGNVFDE